MNNYTETTENRMIEIFDAGRRLKQLEDQGYINLLDMANLVEKENVLVEWFFYNKVSLTLFKRQPKKEKKRLTNFAVDAGATILAHYEETGDLTVITEMKNQMKELWFPHFNKM